MRKRFWKSCLFFLIVLPTQAASFMNLSFDDAVVNNVTELYGDIVIYGQKVFQGQASDLFPGWTIVGALNGIKTTTGYLLLQSQEPPPGPNVITPAAVLLVPHGPGYALELYTGLVNTDDVVKRDQVSVLQTGQIPSDAMFLQYYTSQTLWNVEINGKSIPVTPLTDLAQFNFSGQGEVQADISAFAGQTVELKFTTSGPIDGRQIPDFQSLDSIQFVVPEASTWMLLSVGGIAMAIIYMQRTRAWMGMGSDGRNAR